VSDAIFGLLPPDIPWRTLTLDLLHIQRLEPISQAANPAGNGQQG
jgi:hypothetical protein